MPGHVRERGPRHAAAAGTDTDVSLVAVKTLPAAFPSHPPGGPLCAPAPARCNWSGAIRPQEEWMTRLGHLNTGYQVGSALGLAG
jgi:hypothetical protein